MGLVACHYHRTPPLRGRFARSPPPWHAQIHLSKRKKLLFVVLPLLVLALAWWGRKPLVRLAPIEHHGVIKRIKPFHKGGISQKVEKTRQLNQFAMIFADGFECEGTDTSFAAIEVGDEVVIRGYHDVAGWPVFDPEWWECDEAQLVELVQGAEDKPASQ